MATRRRSYPRWLVYGLGIFALGMTILSAVTSREHHSAESARNAALSRLVALESRDLQASDPSLAMQLALVSWRLSHTNEARSVLADTTTGEMPTRLLGPAGPTSIALGDDGHRLAVAYRASGEVEIYSLRYAQLTLLATVPVRPASAKLDSVAIDDSGRLLAAGYSSGQVRVWSLASPAHPVRLATVSAGSGAAYGLSFSPAGGALAAADADGSVQRWSLTRAGHSGAGHSRAGHGGAGHGRPGHGGAGHSRAGHSGAAHSRAGHAGPERLVAAAALVAPGRPALHAVSYSRTGRTLTAVGRYGAVVVWHAHAGTRPLTALAAGGRVLRAVTYSPDGHTLAVAGANHIVYLWTLTGNGRPGAARPSLTTAGAVNSLAFSRDGRYLAAGAANDSVDIWSTASAPGSSPASSTWSEVAKLPHPAAVTGVTFTDDDRHLLSSDAAGTARIWQFPPPSTHTTKTDIHSLTYSPDTPRLTVGGSRTGATEQWDVANEWRPAPVGAWDAPALPAVTNSPYATITTTTTTPTQTSTAGSATPAAFNPHAGDEALRQTRAATPVLGSALSPDGELFAAAGEDHLVWLWDVTDPSRPKLLAKLRGFTRWATAVVFSNDSQTLFTASADHTVRIWDLTNVDKPQQLPNSPLTGPASAIEQLALSPDGRTLAASTADGRVWLWGVLRPSKANLLGTLLAVRGRPTALAFSPTDNILAAGDSNRQLTFWHYRPYQAVNRICALAGTPITDAEWQRFVPGAPYSPPCENWTPPAPPSGAPS